MKSTKLLGLTVLLAVLAMIPAWAADPADIKAIKDRGILKVGVKVDVPKFGYRDPKTTEIGGYEIDIARSVAKAILGDAGKIEFTPVTAKTRGPLLDTGEIDLVIATFTITEERKKSYNFSDPYFIDGVALMVKKDAGFKGLKDLAGKKIGVAQSSTTQKAITEELTKLGATATFLSFNTYPEIKAALDSKRVDCFSVDSSILWGYMDASTMLLPDRFSPQNYGIASKKDNVALAALVNDVVASLKKSGDNDKLLAKWELK